MTVVTGLTEHNAVLERLHAVAAQSLARFDLPSSRTIKLVNVSENATFRVAEVGSNRRWALRVHRDGYHSRRAIASELAWLIALRADCAVVTPKPIRGLDGEFIQTVGAAGLLPPRNVVLFEWEAGVEPAASDVAGFETLGETAARMHAHVKTWHSPKWFERHTWDFDTTLGSQPHWGRWQDGIGVTPEIASTFQKTITAIAKRLDHFGKAPERFGLIHGDMRLANLLRDDNAVKVIDFDDCGFSWFLYDCATTVSFFEDAPEVPELLAAWARGYRRIGVLSTEDEAEIATFVMLRRLLLVAWIGSHSETELAQSMGLTYTLGTVPLCERYLSVLGQRDQRSALTARALAADQRLWQKIFD